MRSHEGSDTRVSVIIPAYNEADVISETVRAALGIPGVSEVIVVDDGSSDATAEVARAAGADSVLALQQNLGKGGALNKAWPLATGEILLLLDADLGPSAGEAADLLKPLFEDEADMAVALFNKSVSLDASDGGPSLTSGSGGFGLVMRTARFGIWAFTRQHVASPLAGPRALRREIIEKAGGFAPRFGVEVALTIDALRLKYRVVEVPVSMAHRASGRNLRGFMHRGSQLMDIVRTLSGKAIRS